MAERFKTDAIYFKEMKAEDPLEVIQRQEIKP